MKAASIRLFDVSKRDVAIITIAAQIGAAIVNMSGKSLEEGRTVHPYDLIPQLKRNTDNPQGSETVQQKKERWEAMEEAVKSGEKHSREFKDVPTLPVRF